MSLDRELPTPLYFQLKTFLLEEILAGRYGLGRRLPTEHELCARLGVSRTPVTRALSELAREGVVQRTPRRGTFVDPAWLRARADGATLRAVVPPGPWPRMLEDAAAGEVRVEVLQVERPQLYAVLRRAVGEGRAPDLAVLDSVWAPEFAEAGYLHAVEELDPAWLRAAEPDLVEPLRRANRHDGWTFGLSAFGDVAGVWCRRDALARAGAEVPTSWAELEQVAGALAAEGEAPLALPGGRAGAETTSYCLLAVLASNGAAVLGDDGVTLGQPAATEGLRFLAGLAEAGLLPADAVDAAWDLPVRLLAEGRAAFSLGGSYEARRLADAVGATLVELPRRFAFVPVPAGPRGGAGSVVGTMVYGVFRQSAHPHAAMRLLGRALVPEALAREAAATGRIPSRRSAAALAAPALPFVGETAAMLERAAVRPSTPRYPAVSLQLQTMLEDVLTRRLGPAAATRRTAELVGAITGLPVAADPGVAVPG